MQWPWRKTKKPKPTIPAGAERRRLLYKGRVQAVGFRFTAEGCAEQAGVTGWVANQSDGSVLCEVQGTTEQVVTFKRLLQEQIESPQTWIEGYLAEESLIEARPESRFGIRGL